MRTTAPVLYGPTGQPVAPYPASSVAGVNARAGVTRRDPNPLNTPYKLRGIAGVSGLYDEIRFGQPVIQSAMSQVEELASQAQIAIQWPEWFEVTPEAEAFVEVCRRWMIDSPIIYQGQEGAPLIAGGPSFRRYLIEGVWYGFSLFWPKLTSPDLATADVVWYPVDRSTINRFVVNQDTVTPAEVMLTSANGSSAPVSYGEFVHIVHGVIGAGEFEGRGLLRTLLQIFALWKDEIIRIGVDGWMRSGFLDIEMPPGKDPTDWQRAIDFANGFRDGLQKVWLHTEGEKASITFPPGGSSDRLALLEYYDARCREVLNAQLSGLNLRAGSRAMAEVVADNQTAQARAWFDSVLERCSAPLFGWCARVLGYSGPLPIMQCVAIETSQTDGTSKIAAAVQANQAGLLRIAPADEVTFRDWLGMDPLVEEETAEGEAPSEVSTEPKPAPLPGVTLTVAMDILGRLRPTDPLQAPLASPVAVLLLVNAGFPRADAESMVAGQLGMAAPAPVVGPAGAPATTPAPASAAGGSAEPLPEVPSVTLPGNVTVPDTLAGAFAPGVSAAMADSDRWLLLSESVVCADVDTTPPVTVREAVKVAIEAHRKAATRHRVGSAMLLALARDLAGGRRIDARRLHALAEWFRQRGDSVKGGAGYAAGHQSRHLYDLRGGDAARAWLRTLMQRIASAHVTRAALLGEPGEDADPDGDTLPASDPPADLDAGGSDE